MGGCIILWGVANGCGGYSLFKIVVKSIAIITQITSFEENRVVCGTSQLWPELSEVKEVAKHVSVLQENDLVETR